MKKVSAAKLITCILPMGKALPLLEALAEKGIRTANFAHARGRDIQDTQTSSRLLPQEDEKEIVTIVAETEAQADEIFSFCFEHADMNRKGGGLIYQSALGFTTPYSVEAKAPTSH